MKYRSEERIPYQTLKGWALDAYYEGCRDHAVRSGWPHEQVMGYVSYIFEEGFDRPVEDVMWNAILLVLSGGWHKEIEQNIRKMISEHLEAHGIDKLLTNVPDDEAEAFRHDLRILKFIE